MTLKESTAQDTALAAKASPQVPDQGGENDGKKQHSKAFLVLAAMGPGIVTAMAGNDAGGISTYSTVGAKFGYMTLWIIPVMCVLLIVVQTTATRMGVVTGKGFSALIRESFGIRLTALAMLALLIGNVATTFSEFAGVASGMEIFGVPRWISVPVAAAAVWGLIVGGSYKRVQNIFLVLSCVFATYIVAAFLAQPDWNETFQHTLVPAASSDLGFLSLTVAMVGTTIAPWMMFFAQSNVVEKGVRVRDLPYQRIDAVTGAVVGCIVAWFIIVTTGTVLFPQGIEVESAEAAAAALEPFAGQYAKALFAIGLVAASLLAACVLPLTTAFVICEAFRLGSRRFVHLERSAPLQGHLHVCHRRFCSGYSYSQHRLDGNHAHRTVCKRRHFACIAGVHGHHLHRQTRYGQIRSGQIHPRYSVLHHCGGGHSFRHLLGYADTGNRLIRC